MAPHGTGTLVTGPAQPDISFSSYTAEASGDLEDIYRLAPATGQVTRVTAQATPESTSHRGGDWSPDRTRLVGFGSADGGFGTRTRVFDATTGAVQAELTWGESSPTWLDDHTVLVIERGWATVPGQQHHPLDEVFAIDLDAWSVRQVTQLGAGFTVHSMRWHPRGGLALDVSPDEAVPWAGRRVATVAAARVQRAASGTGAPVGPRDLRRPFGVTPTAAPDWSPDGARLAVVRLHADDGPWAATDIAVGSVRSGRLTVLVDGSGLADDGDPARPSGYGMPAWSPDGASIAWVEYYRDGWGEVWVMDSTGRRQRQVTSFDHTEVVVSLDW